MWELETEGKMYEEIVYFSVSFTVVREDQGGFLRKQEKYHYEIQGEEGNMFLL